MFGKRITLFKLLGFKVSIDISWFVIAVLISWSLAEGLFPHYFPGLPVMTYWFLGVAGAVGLFASIVFHELCHSLVARRFELPMKGITLFIFGGVAEMSEEPKSAKAEFFMAMAGPASSLILGLFFYAVLLLSEGAGLPVFITGVINYLAYINWLLAGFNLVPAFPLDGGRILRAALWHWKDNLRWATRIASRAGSLFGMVLIVMGVLNILTGNFIGGIWWFLIGMFIRNASQMSYQQVLTRKALEGEKVERFMNQNPVTVNPSLSIKELVEDYIYKFHFKMFPVVEDGRLVGCITTHQVKGIPKEEWEQRKVGDILDTCSSENTINPADDALKAMAIMNKSGNSRLMVTKGDRLVGIISLKDILRFLSVKLEIEADEQ